MMENAVPVKVIPIDFNTMNAWLNKNPAQRLSNPFNALDPTSPEYKVPEFAEKTINEMEANGFKFICFIQGSGLVFRDMTDLRNIALEIEERQLDGHVPRG
jgi:hypothetical protein